LFFSNEGANIKCLINKTTLFLFKFLFFYGRKVYAFNNQKISIMIIVLLGYMGSGKSTIGKELATVLNYRFLDLDDYISEKESATIPELFQSKGEIYFRKKESQYLGELLKSAENLVLALGGGTPCYGTNMEIVLQHLNIKSFYLKLSIPNLCKRLFKEREQRPLISHLSSEEALIEFVGKHLFERVQYYNQANHTINADDKTKTEVLEEILTKLI
jgi:shikimate kinase